MAEFSKKQTADLRGLLADEERLVKKISVLAKKTADMEAKQKVEQISLQHQGHFNTLYEMLK